MPTWKARLLRALGGAGQERAGGAEAQAPTVLPLLLMTFPLAIGLAGQPLLVGLVALAYGCLALRAQCLRAFALTVLGALGVSLLVFSGTAVYSDVDHYLAPQVRLLVLPAGLTPDGAFDALQCLLPQGYAAYGAALYRLTGSVDLGSSAFYLTFVAAWLVLRSRLTRLQTGLLLLVPNTFMSIFNLMPEGSVYCLLVVALFALRGKQFWLALLPCAVACTYKVSAWIPAGLIGGVLVFTFPRRWWQCALGALGVAGIVLPTLKMLMGGGLAGISADFLSANADAQSMGYWARLAYVYLGHWTASGAPDFGVHQVGIDGACVDAYGALFRVLIWGGLGLAILFWRAFKPWVLVWAIAWVSVLAIPTLYIGYARYTPLLYVAGLLPWVVLLPRLAIAPAVVLNVLPVAFLGWRVVLASEAVMVANHATAVQSSFYNVRSTFRPILREESQPCLSGGLGYTYRLPSEDVFPEIERELVPNLGELPFRERSRGLYAYVWKEWVPWAIARPLTYCAEMARFRARAFRVFPRGKRDGVPPVTEL